MPNEKKLKNNHKLGIIVPYRDRPEQLKRFVKHMGLYLQDIEYEIFIVEQSDAKPFNRGKLLNVGYKSACDKGCDYFVFHDVDMLPEDVDYSYSDKPLHLATHLQEHDYETTFFDYFGGVTMFTKEDFKTINGFSNEYWGWGFEDDDLLVRCISNDLELDTEVIGDSSITEFEAFEFSGESSFITIKNKLNTSKLLENDFTISVLVKPQNVKFSENGEYDELPIISIPGYNIGLFYNSFRRFFCQAYDVNNKPYSISTDIIGERWVYLTMVYRDDKFIELYQNGILLESIKLSDSILQLNSNEIFIGAANGKNENTDFFYGLIADIEIYDTSLSKEEIKEISENPLKPKIRNFGKYKSSEFLYSQILAELSTNKISVDLSLENEVSLKNIYLHKTNESFNTFLPKPYRRDSRFKSLKHKSNSSIGNRWVHQETRKNQIRFYNDVRHDLIDSKDDGISTLEYKILDTTTSNNITKILVEI